MSTVFPILLVVAVTVTVVWLLYSPLRPGRAEQALEAAEAERSDLEARRDAKYREIRDAELDHRMGKLSRADWRALDRGLRAEAVALLKALDALDGREDPAAEAALAPEPAGDPSR